MAGNFFSQLGQPPRNRDGNYDPREIARWFDRLWLMLSSTIGIPWGLIIKADSSLKDLATRPHSDLTDVRGWTSGTDVVQDKHVSEANGKKWEDHVNITAGNPHGTTKTDIGLGNVTNDQQAKLAGDNTQDFAAKTLVTSDIGTTPAKPWRLGRAKPATIIVDTNKYIEVEIDGVLYKLVTTV